MRLAGPRDGWYRFTAQRFRAGLSASRRFGSHWSGAIAAGTMFVEQHQGVYLALFPFYLELSIGHGG